MQRTARLPSLGLDDGLELSANTALTVHLGGARQAPRRYFRREGRVQSVHHRGGADVLAAAGYGRPARGGCHLAARSADVPVRPVWSDQNAGRHEALLHELGADEFIDYARTRPEDVVREVDLVVDAVGGPDTGRFLRTLRRGGALFPIFPLGFDGAAEAEKVGTTVSTTQVRSSGTQLSELAGLLDAGAIRVVIDSSFPPADAGRAHERAARGQHPGRDRAHGAVTSRRERIYDNRDGRDAFAVRRRPR